MRYLHRILVPWDFSECSSAALDYAVFLARPFGAEIDVLHVWNMRTDGWHQGRAISLFAESPTGIALAECIELAKRDGGVRIRGRLEFGELCSTITTVANTDGFDLVALGVHGRRRLSHLFNGHLAQRVARDVACPVIAVHGTMTNAEESCSRAWSIEAEGDIS